MKIYSIGMYESPSVETLAGMTSVEFAHFSVLGTWTYRREPCKSCDYYWQEIAPPLLVRWEPSTDRMGDFSWDGPFGSTFVITSQVAAGLKKMGFGCTFGPVRVVKPARKRRTVPFPYEGPKLCWGQCSTEIELDMKASCVKLESSCSECGDKRYTFRNSGIVIRRKQWKRQLMFRISTNGPEVVFVTEEGRKRLQDAQFSNIAFTEAGEIVA